MSKLEELIQKLCPDGAEYISIGSTVNYEQPSKYIVNSTDYNDDFSTPVLTAGQSFILGYTDEKDNLYSASKENPVIIFDDFTGAFKWVDFPFKVKSSAMKMLTANAHKTTLRYIYHSMGNIGYSSDEHKRLWISIYSEIKIPLPPLPVQQEIVRILDKFTELEAELEAELVARNKQYEYYRDELLTFGDDIQSRTAVRWMTLGEIADIGTGSSNTNEELEVGNYPFFVRSQEVRRKNTFEYDETAIITSGDGVGVGKIFHYIEGKYALHQRAYRIHINDESVLPKYYYHYMRSSFLPYIQRNAVNSSVTSIRRHMLTDFPVPIPSVEEQERIVAILDRFDTLVNDITQGLPAEIAARRKQYEYYRDKLLTFKEKVS